jgi:small subunit ribosomal protein S2
MADEKVAEKIIEEETTSDGTKGMLVDRTEYLTSGVHIGMKTCTKYMKRFVYKIRDDGLSVFNVQKVDERVVVAAKFLSGFEKIMAVSRKSNGMKAVIKFSDIVGGKHVAGRFHPGTLTNPSFKDFFEPDVIIVVDPLIDKQAVLEAKKKRIPVVALCDTFNDANDVDVVIPMNNNGKKAIALIFWLLSREVLKNRGKIKSNGEFKHDLKEFGSE